MKLKITYLFVVLALTFNTLGQKNQGGGNSKSTKASPTVNKKFLPEIFSDELIDTSVKNLPANYCGNKIIDVAIEIDRRERLTKMLVKGEFETTPQFLERVKKFKTEKKKSFFGIFDYNSTFAIETNNNNTFKYNADNELMSFELHNYYIWLTDCKSISDKQQYSDSLNKIDNDISIDLLDLGTERMKLLARYTSEYSEVRDLTQKINDLEEVQMDIKIQTNRVKERNNLLSSKNLAFLPITISEPTSFSFRSSFKLNISEAEKVKPNLRTLLIVSISGKEGNYFSRNSISRTLKLNLQEIWIYNNQTGEIFLKKKIERNENQ